MMTKEIDGERVALGLLLVGKVTRMHHTDAGMIDAETGLLTGLRLLQWANAAVNGSRCAFVAMPNTLWPFTICKE